MQTRGRRAFALGAALALSSAGAPAGAQNDDQRESPEVRELVLAGVNALSKGELEETIATAESKCRNLLLRPICAISHSSAWWEKYYLDRAEFRRDVLRIKVFYYKRGFRGAQVDTAIAHVSGGVRVEFRITEGPPTVISKIVVAQTNPVLSDDQIASRMRVRAGQPLNLIALDSSVVLLRTLLSELGYADAALAPSTAADDSLNVGQIGVAVDPRWRATVQEIRIEGNEKVSRRTILNSLTFRPGSTYRLSDVMRSQRNLYESALFLQAVIVVPPEGDSTKIVRVTVHEAPLREARASAGFNTIDFFQTEGRYAQNNWFGGARRLELRGVIGNLLAPQLSGNLIFRDATRDLLPGEDEDVYLRPTWLLSADITQPWFRSPKNTIGTSAFAHRRSAPGIFVDRGFGAGASFTRQLAVRAPATANYRFEVTQVDAGDVYFCVNFGVCEGRTIEALRGRQRLSPLQASLFTDRTNDLFAPSAGYLARFDAEHASKYTLSDFQHNRIFAEASKYRSVGRDMVLAGRARAGWVRALAGTARAVGLRSTVARPGDAEILHPRKRFYSGGSQSVRGYGENQLGPRILTVDPKRLVNAGCTFEGAGGSGAAVTCTSQQLETVDNDQFQPRPLGGSSLLEGSLELRFPVWNKLSGAVFVDGAFVGQRGFESITEGNGAVTPGLGVRYTSPAGAIRIDLGIRPTIQEQLAVVTETRDSVTGERNLVTVQGAATGVQLEKTYSPAGGSGGFLRELLSRLTLHLSIGQAF